MLKSLYISDLALIRRLSVDFDRGFTVLTGQTGAGKSLVLDAFHLFSSRAARPDLVRAGAEKLTVSLYFTELSDGAKTALGELLSTAELEEGVTLTREITSAGKSQMKLNGRSYPYSALAPVFPALFVVNGQHDSGGLLEEKTHLSYLDEALDGAGKQALEEYRALYRAVRALQKEYAEAAQSGDEKEKIEWYDYQLKSIARVKPRVGEEEELEERLKALQENAARHKALQTALRALSGGEKGKGAVYLLEAAAARLESLGGEDPAYPAAETLYALARTAAEKRDEVASVLALLGDEDVEKEEDRIRERIDALYRLKTRYGKTIEDVIAHYENLRAEKEKITSRAQTRKRLAPILKEKEAALREKAALLSALRERAARKLEQDVHKTLAFLDMPKMVFSVALTGREALTEDGAESVCFLICANTGEGAKPLSKAASGGELSRILLALQCHLGTTKDADTLVFDEIDTGISGATAQRVGVCLKTLSQKKQILCVTHSAQVATLCDRHFLVEKAEDAGRTETRVFPLSPEESDREAARLLGGKEVGPEAIAAARTLRREGLGEWERRKEEF